MENILHTENSKPIGVSHIGKTCKKHMEYHFMLVVYNYQFSYQLQVSETLARCERGRKCGFPIYYISYIMSSVSRMTPYKDMHRSYQLKFIFHIIILNLVKTNTLKTNFCLIQTNFQASFGLL